MSYKDQPGCLRILHSRNTRHQPDYFEEARDRLLNDESRGPFYRPVIEDFLPEGS